MKRKQIELYMKEKGLKQIDLIFNEDDKYATYCMLQAGYLKNYNARPVDRNIDIWGYAVWKNGKQYRIAFEEK